MPPIGECIGAPEEEQEEEEGVEEEMEEGSSFTVPFSDA